MSNIEIALKKFIIGSSWEDAELSSEGAQDLLDFPEVLQELMANPVIAILSANAGAAKLFATKDDLLEQIENPSVKAILKEKRAADNAGTEEELLERWEAEILPYIRCRQK